MVTVMWPAYSLTRLSRGFNITISSRTRENRGETKVNYITTAEQYRDRKGKKDF